MPFALRRPPSSAPSAATKPPESHSGAPPSRIADLENRLDLDRDVVGQRAHAHGRAGMDAIRAEYFGEQVGAAVDDLGVIGEIGRRVDHAEQLDHPPDGRQVAHLLAGYREEIEPREA